MAKAIVNVPVFDSVTAPHFGEIGLEIDVVVEAAELRTVLASDEALCAIDG